LPYSICWDSHGESGVLKAKDGPLIFFYPIVKIFREIYRHYFINTSYNMRSEISFVLAAVVGGARAVVPAYAQCKFIFPGVGFGTLIDTDEE
jgi:hypothetical protein